MKKGFKWIIFLINVLGLLCLIYYSIPYITHSTVVSNPDAMLPAEAWDEAGMTLTFGFIPLVVANTLGFIMHKRGKVCCRILWFIPSVICLLIVISYWILALK